MLLRASSACPSSAADIDRATLAKISSCICKVDKIWNAGCRNSSLTARRAQIQPTVSFSCIASHSVTHSHAHSLPRFSKHKRRSIPQTPDAAVFTQTEQTNRASKQSTSKAATMDYPHDPDELFGKCSTCDLVQVFGVTDPHKKMKLRRRRSSDDWSRDRVTSAEKAQYKREKEAVARAHTMQDFVPPKMMTSVPAAAVRFRGVRHRFIGLVCVFSSGFLTPFSLFNPKPLLQTTATPAFSAVKPPPTGTAPKKAQELKKQRSPLTNQPVGSWRYKFIHSKTTTAPTATIRLHGHPSIHWPASFSFFRLPFLSHTLSRFFFLLSFPPNLFYRRPPRRLSRQPSKPPTTASKAFVFGANQPADPNKKQECLSDEDGDDCLRTIHRD